MVLVRIFQIFKVMYRYKQLSHKITSGIYLGLYIEIDKERQKRMIRGKKCFNNTGR